MPIIEDDIHSIILCPLYKVPWDQCLQESSWKAILQQGSSIIENSYSKKRKEKEVLLFAPVMIIL